MRWRGINITYPVILSASLSRLLWLCSADCLLIPDSSLIIFSSLSRSLNRCHHWLRLLFAPLLQLIIIITLQPTRHFWAHGICRWMLDTSHDTHAQVKYRVTRKTKRRPLWVKKVPIQSWRNFAKCWSISKNSFPRNSPVDFTVIFNKVIVTASSTHETCC